MFYNISYSNIINIVINVTKNNKRYEYVIMSEYSKEVIFMEFEKTKLIELKEKFDSIINTAEKENIEFWYARDLQIQLGYKRQENFFETIKKAMKSCENAGIEVDNHFREVTKMVQIGSGARRNLQDYMLTRYACYCAP